MAKLIALKLDASNVDGLLDKLSNFDSDKLGVLLVDTLNSVGEETYDISKKHITGGINIDADYLNSDRFQFEKATANNPTVRITAKGYETTISHYGAMRFSQKVKHPERAKGDPRRGLAKGEKEHIAIAQVTRGSAKSIGKKFTIIDKSGALIRDNSGNPILFKGLGRPGKGRRQAIEPVLGPSVYQLFRHTIDDIQEGVLDNLAEAVLARAEKEFEKIT